MKTGVASWKIAKGLYFVPLLFAYTPLLGGDWPVMIEIFAFAIFGLWALGAGIQGHWENKLNPVMRIAVFAVGAALLWPLGTLYHAIALAAFFALFAINIGFGKKRAAARAEG